MTTIKRIHPLSAGKVLGVLYALLGLIFGVIISLITFISHGNSSVLFAIGIIVLVPLFYGVLGLVFGIILAGLYNLTTKWTGGVKIDTTD